MDRIEGPKVARNAVLMNQFLRHLKMTAQQANNMILRGCDISEKSPVCLSEIGFRDDPHADLPGKGGLKLKASLRLPPAGIALAVVFNSGQSGEIEGVARFR